MFTFALDMLKTICVMSWSDCRFCILFSPLFVDVDVSLEVDVNMDMDLDVDVDVPIRANCIDDNFFKCFYFLMFLFFLNVYQSNSQTQSNSQ